MKRSIFYKLKSVLLFVFSHLIHISKTTADMMAGGQNLSKKKKTLEMKNLRIWLFINKDFLQILKSVISANKDK